MFQTFWVYAAPRGPGTVSKTILLIQVHPLIRYLCNWSTNDDPSVDEPATFILVCALATVLPVLLLVVI